MSNMLDKRQRIGRRDPLLPFVCVREALHFQILFIKLCRKSLLLQGVNHYPSTHPRWLCSLLRKFTKILRVCSLESAYNATSSSRIMLILTTVLSSSKSGSKTHHRPLRVLQTVATSVTRVGLFFLERLIRKEQKNKHDFDYQLT